MDAADAETIARWEFLKATWPRGREVEGAVVHHAPFGIFLDLGEGPILGLVLLPEMPDDLSMPRDGRLHLPPVGSRVRTHVLGFRDSNLQVELTMLGPSRPSERR